MTEEEIFTAEYIPGETLQQSLDRTGPLDVAQSPRPVREIIPETPQWLCNVINKPHAKDPANRFQTAWEVANVLAAGEASIDAFSTGRRHGRCAASICEFEIRSRRAAAANFQIAGNDQRRTCGQTFEKAEGKRSMSGESAIVLSCGRHSAELSNVFTSTKQSGTLR